MIQIDMKKPEVCGECPFVNTNKEYPYCEVLKSDRGYPFDVNKKRFPNCPLKEVEEKPVEDDELSKRKDICRIMFNRCRAVMSADGMMCIFCGMRKMCDEECSVGGK